MDRIPIFPLPAGYTVDYSGTHPFVRIQNDARIEVQMQYPLMPLANAETGCYLRREAYERLLDAARSLPVGIRLRVMDAWRPFALQRELVDYYGKGILRDLGLENADKDTQAAAIRQFVSLPNEDREKPPVHTTGGAVDVTLTDEAGTPLDMGGDFDGFGEASHTAHFETVPNETVRQNRRLLYRTMTAAGFTNLPSEWWHYDYGDGFWSFYTGKPAIYKGCFTKDELF